MNLTKYTISYIATIACFWAAGFSQSEEAIGNRIDSIPLFESPGFAEPTITTFESLALFRTTSDKGGTATWQKAVTWGTGAAYSTNPRQTPVGDDAFAFTSSLRAEGRREKTPSESSASDEKNVYSYVALLEAQNFENSDRDANVMESSATAVAEYTRTGSILKLTGRGFHQRYDDTTALAGARGSAEFAFRRQGIQFPLQAVVEKRDARTLVTDPRRNKDAIRAGASVSGTGQLDPKLGAKARFTASYIYTVQYAKGSDEDYDSQQGAFSITEVVLGFDGRLALEKFEASFEKRFGDNPHSRIATGSTRDDVATKASLTFRFVTKKQAEAAKGDSAKARYKWRAGVGRTIQDSTVYGSDFNATAAFVSLTGIF